MANIMEMVVLGEQIDEMASCLVCWAMFNFTCIMFLVCKINLHINKCKNGKKFISEISNIKLVDKVAEKKLNKYIDGFKDAGINKIIALIIVLLYLTINIVIYILYCRGNYAIIGEFCIVLTIIMLVVSCIVLCFKFKVINDDEIDYINLVLKETTIIKKSEIPIIIKKDDNETYFFIEYKSKLINVSDEIQSYLDNKHLTSTNDLCYVESNYKQIDFDCCKLITINNMELIWINGSD